MFFSLYDVNSSDFGSDDQTHKHVLDDRIRYFLCLPKALGVCCAITCRLLRVLLAKRLLGGA